MKVKDRVLVAIAGRAKGRAYGWAWQDFPATVIVVNDADAVVIIERDGWDRQELVPQKRIKPLANSTRQCVGEST